MAESVPSNILNKQHAVTNFLPETCQILNCSSLQIGKVEQVLARIVTSELMLSINSNTHYVDPMVINALAQAKHILSNISFKRPAFAHIKAETMFSGHQRKQTFFISKKHFEFFFAYGFHCPDAGKILGVCQSTVQSQLNQFGLSTKISLKFLTVTLMPPLKKLK